MNEEMNQVTEKVVETVANSQYTPMECFKAACAGSFVGVFVGAIIYEGFVALHEKHKAKKQRKAIKVVNEEQPKPIEVVDEKPEE